MYSLQSILKRTDIMDMIVNDPGPTVEVASMGELLRNCLIILERLLLRFQVQQKPK